MGDALQALRALADRRDLDRIEVALRTQAEAAGELDWDAQIVCGPGPPARRGPGKGQPLDPGKTPASARSVTGWADHQAPHGLRWPGPRPGHSADSGQDADTSELVGLVDAVRVARPGGRGRPRMRPDHLTADKAYSSHGAMLTSTRQGCPSRQSARSEKHAYL
jgi:hypothetical protein